MGITSLMRPTTGFKAQGSFEMPGGEAEHEKEWHQKGGFCIVLLSLHAALAEFLSVDHHGPE